MTVGDIYEVRCEGLTANGSRWNNVFHFELIVEQVADELFTKSKELATVVRQAYEDNVMPVMSDEVSLTSARANRVWPTSGIPAVVAPGGVPGGIAQLSLPADVAVVTTQVTNLPGRNFQGRFYLSGVPQTDVEDDELVAAARQAWADAANNIGVTNRTDASGNEYQPVVFSRSRANQDPPLAPVSAPVQVTLTDLTLRNMRTRGRKLRDVIEGS